MNNIHNIDLIKKWYEIKKTVWRARKQGGRRIVILPDKLYVTDNEYETGYACSLDIAGDEFNWSANALFACESWQQVDFTRNEIDTFLNRIINPTGGYAPASYAADLKRRTGTLEYSNNGWTLTYDKPYIVPWASSAIVSTTFLDAEEAIIYFGLQTVSDVLDGAFKRVAYLTFIGD